MSAENATPEQPDPTPPSAAANVSKSVRTKAQLAETLAEENVSLRRQLGLPQNTVTLRTFRPAGRKTAADLLRPGATPTTNEDF